MEQELLSACFEGELEEVQALLNKSDINVNVTDSANDNETPLMYACVEGKADIVELLLNDHRTDVNMRDDDGETAFYLVCQSGKTDLVKLFLRNEKVDINIPDNNNETPLMKAASWGYLEIVQLILMSGREINLNSTEGFGKTAIDLAKDSLKMEVVDLLELYKQNPEAAREKMRGKVESIAIEMV